MLLHEKLAVCHGRDAPRLTECMCTFMVERKMRESKQNAMATSVHTRNDRDSMAPATAANGLRTVTRWRSTWLNHAYPLGRSPLSLVVAAAVVAICCKTRKSADSASRWVRPIALVDEGGTAHFRSPLSVLPAPTRERSPRGLGRN